MNARPGLALFDLDLTLLPIDSDHAWGEFVIREGWVDEAAFRAGNDAFYEQYKAGRLDIDAYVAFAAAPLRERSPEQLAEAQARFMRDVIAPAIRPAATALVETHRARGDLLAIVTSTNDFITLPIAAAFGIEALIATRHERDGAGVPSIQPVVRAARPSRLARRRDRAPPARDAARRASCAG